MRCIFKVPRAKGHSGHMALHGELKALTRVCVRLLDVDHVLNYSTPGYGNSRSLFMCWQIGLVACEGRGTLEGRRRFMHAKFLLRSTPYDSALEIDTGHQHPVYRGYPYSRLMPPLSTDRMLRGRRVIEA